MGVDSWRNCHPTEKKVLGRRVINVATTKKPPYVAWVRQVNKIKKKVHPDLGITFTSLRGIVRFILVYTRNELARIASEIAATNSKTSSNSTTEIHAAEIEAAVNQLLPKQLAQGALQHAFEAMNYYQSQKDDNQPDNLLDKLDKMLAVRLRHSM